MKVWQTGAGSFPVAGDSVTIRHQVTSATNESIAHFYLISNSLALLPNTLTISGDSYWLSGSMDADIQFQGSTFTWNGGVYLGAFSNSSTATFVLAGADTKTLRNYAAFHNYGAVQQAGAGPLALNGNPNTAYLYNWTNALYDIQTDGTNLTANYGVFENYGALRKSSGSGTSWVNSTFNNHGGTVEVQTGTLVLNGAGTRSNGTLAVSSGATLELTGTASPIYQGAFSGTGPGIVQFSGGQIAQNSDATFTLTNGLYWRGGTISAAYLYNQSLMLIEGAAQKTIRYYGQLHNYGTIRHTGTGALAINGNPNTAYLYNWTNALYDIQADGTNFTSDMGYFCNYGTFRKSAGAGTSVVASAFNNYNGTIEVQTGSLVLNGAGTRSNGVLDVAAGATLDLFGSAGAQYRGTFSGSGSGVVQIAGGELGIDCDITFNLINGLYWRGGNINRSFLRNDGLMFLDGAATKTVRYYGQLINNGDIRHTGAGNLSLIDGDARLINQSNNLYDIQSDGTNISGSGQVHNYGTLMKSVGGGTSWISSAYYHDNGTINVQTGTLVLAASGTRSNGVLDVAAGATLDLFGSASGVKYYGTFTGSGSGIVQIAGGVFGDDSRVTFDLPNGLYWRGGRLNRSYLQNDGLMFMDGPATKEVTLYGDVYNHGTIRHTGAGNLYLAAGSATRLYNYSNALYDIQSDGTNISGSGQVHNYGALCKSAGSGTSVVACTFYNYGGMVESRSGTLKFNSLTHTGGTLRLNGGDLSVPAFTLQAGLLEGTGTLTVAGTLSSSATVSPGLSAGILNIAGNYSQGAAGALDIEIGGRAAGSQHDRLDITGSAALNGTLNVALTNGFIPALTDAFTLVSCASRSGVFSGTNLPAIGADRRWVVVYSNTAVPCRCRA